MLRNIGPFEWVLILLLVLLLFGPDRLADLGKDLGTALHGFKDGLQGGAAPSPAPSEENHGADHPAT